MKFLERQTGVCVLVCVCVCDPSTRPTGQITLEMAFTAGLLYYHPSVSEIETD